MPVLHIHLLGDFRLIHGEALVTTFVQARLQALLAYLLLHAGSPLPRQRLAFLFWPDTPEPQAHTNLRQLLHNLRRSLPAADQYLQVETKTVLWRQEAAYTLDIADFENELTQAAAAANEGQSASERTALATAVEFYRGDLLAGNYDHWILPERERLSKAYLSALERLILLTEEQRDYPAAIAYAECLLRHDPLHEMTYRGLMRLHALHGDRARALRVYHTCVSVLERELGVRPDQDTQEAYQRLLNLQTLAVLQAQTMPHAAVRPTLVGRHAAWGKLRSAWRRVVADQAALVLISGEAGIGKTRLAEEFLEWTARQGITTARTRSYPAEGQLAYAPVIELLRSEPLCTNLSRLEEVWLAELARLLPELLDERPVLPKPEPITDSSQRQRLFEALARAVLGNLGPLLLLLDDVQWCDQDTLEWLHYLLHYSTQAKLLLLCAVRLEEVEQSHPLNLLLADLRIHAQVTEVELKPLDGGDTAMLAEQLTGRKLDADQASRLYRYTEGNPLFIVETVREVENVGLAKRGLALPYSPNLLPPTFSSPPPKVQAVIQARLRQLSPSAYELAGLAATIGRAFTTDVLARASGSSEEMLVQGLDELWRRRIVREQGRNAYDFSHDRIREVAYAEISPARRQALHLRVATALEEINEVNLDSVSGQIAVHLEYAGRSEQAVAYYRRAADVAQKTFSHGEASSLLVQGLKVLPTLPDSVERTRTELSLLIRLGTALMASRGYGHPEVEQTLLHTWDLCQNLGAHEQSIPVLAGLWLCYNLKGDLAQQAIWAERLERAVRNSSAPAFNSFAHFALAGTALFRGDFPASRQYSERGLRFFDSGQNNLPTPPFGVDPGIILLPGLALSLWLLGYPDQARNRVQLALDLAYESRQPATIGAALGMSTVIYQWRGDVSTTLDQAAVTIAYASEKQMPQWVAHGGILHGWALGQAGEPGEGIHQLRQGLDAWQAMGARLSLTYYLLLLTEICVLSGQIEGGLETLAEALAIAQAGGESWMEAELNRRRGELLLEHEADEQEVEACFQRALEISRVQQARSFELRAATSLCRLWQRQGKHSPARTLLTECYAWFTEGFDTADLRQARALLDSF